MEHLYTVTVANAAKSIDKLLSGPGFVVFFSISLDVVEFRLRVICLGMVSFGGSKRKFTQISADENGCCDLLSFV